MSKDELGIKPEFSSFWIPMSQAMLSPKTTVHLILPSFLIAKYEGISISQSFFLILKLLTLELSIASPGITSAWTILFASIMLPVEYVGIFTVYKMLTTNFASAGGMMYASLEHIEMADITGALDKSVYKVSVK